MALLLGRLRVTLTWAEILRRTFVDAIFKHNCLGMAAQLAYYFFFSLFPALLFLIAVASYFPITTLIDEIVGTLGQFAPPEFLTIVTDQIRKISGDRAGRPPDARHPDGTVEQFHGDDRNHRHRQPRLWSRRRAVVVEGSLDRDRTDVRSRASSCSCRSLW